MDIFFRKLLKSYLNLVPPFFLPSWGFFQPHPMTRLVKARTLPLDLKQYFLSFMYQHSSV